MVEVKADPIRNRLYLKVSEAETTAVDVERAIGLLEIEVAKLRPGWVAAVDLRGADMTNSAVKRRIEQIQAVIAAGEPSKVCSILDSQIPKVQLLKTSGKNQRPSFIQRFTDEREWLRAVYA